MNLAVMSAVPHASRGVIQASDDRLSKADRTASNLYVVYILLTTNFFLLDPAFLPRAVSFGISLFALMAIVFTRRVRLQPIFAILFGYLLLLQVMKMDAATQGLVERLYPWGFNHAIACLYLCCERQPVLKNIFKKVSLSFIVLNLPSIVIYFGILLNVPMHYSIVHLGARTELDYRVYYNMAVFGDFQMLTFGQFTVTRLCGAFEEANMLTSYVSTLLAAEYIFMPPSKRRWVLLVLGMLSLSLSFYLVVGSFALYQLRRKFVSFSVVFLLFGSLTWFIMPPILRGAFNELIFNRMEVQNGGLAGDTGEIYSGDRYRYYLSSAGTTELVFGHGSQTNSHDVRAGFAGYQGGVFEGGIFGMLLICTFCIYFTILLPARNKNWLALIVTASCFALLYHRFEPLGSTYLLLYAVLQSHFVGDSDRFPQRALRGNP